MELCEIKNVKTLTRWYQAGLIPEPSVEKHPGGAGRIACWPDWVLNHCRTIKELTAKGQTIDEIKEVFGTNWDAIAQRYHRYVFLEVSQKMEFDNRVMDVRELIDETLAAFLVGIRHRIISTALPPIAKEVVIKALDLIREGNNPILILFTDGMVVVPDFLVSHHLAENFDAADPFLLIPLHTLIMKKFKSAATPKSPIIRASSRVQRKKSGEIIEHELLLREGWEFDVVPADKAKSKKKPKS